LGFKTSLIGEIRRAGGSDGNYTCCGDGVVERLSGLVDLLDLRINVGCTDEDIAVYLGSQLGQATMQLTELTMLQDVWPPVASVRV
jgi:hypothetical protein